MQELLNDGKHSFDDLLHGDPGAVANTRKIFDLTSDPALKQRLASILLSIGVRDKVYRDYLEHAAREALADDTPWPIKYNDKGEEQDWDPRFLEWCRVHEQMPWATLKRLRYQDSKPWFFLASSRDPVFYPLFLEGLHSQNLMIVNMAAKGLARLQDSRAIDPLIHAGQHSAGEGRYGIGQALLCFPDARAQAAAELFIPDKKMLNLERQIAREKGGKWLFEW